MSFDAQVTELDDKLAELKRRVDVLYELGRQDKIFKLKWLPPLLATLVCSLVSDVLLGAATQSYASEMLRLEITFGNNSINDLAFFGVDPPNRTQTAQVHDWLLRYQSPAVEEARWRSMEMWDRVMQSVACMFAAAFIISSMSSRALLVWSKAFFSQSLLLLSQGAIALATPTPSPAGWPACRAHLGADLLSRIGNGTEVTPRPGAGVCTGVAPWSGRAAMNAIYALGLYELCEWRTSTWGGAATGTGPFSEWRRLVLFAIGLAGLAQQYFEANGELNCRLNYSAAMLASSAMPLLLYSNGAVAIAAKWWVSYRKPPLTRLPFNDQVKVSGEDKRMVAFRIGELRRMGTVTTPPCCFPFCLLRGHEHLISEAELERTLESHVNDPEDSAHAKALVQLRMRPAEDLLSFLLDGPQPRSEVELP